MTSTPLQTDYLIVGSGAVGLAFADTLLHESEATMVIVDRHHGPGGHWNDAYPYVRLHQPSSYYGVNSRPLGTDAKDATGINQGMLERATGAELVSYYEAVMETLLSSGRVKYFPMSNYTGDWSTKHEFKSLLTGAKTQVNVARRIVDTTYLNTMVPSTHPPKYAIAPGLRCVPLNELPKVKQPHSGYVVVGSGKTGIDACLWLLENNVPADKITWIMPRDAWYFNRANVQPGLEFFMSSYGAFVNQNEAVAAATSVPDLFERLSAKGVLLRLDESVMPSMFHGAIMSKSEVVALRAIKNIVRMGRIQRIEPTQIVLLNGAIPTDPDRLYVDCSASAVERRPMVPVFNGPLITPQFVRTVQPTFSAAFIAHAEITYTDDAIKNKLCGVIPLPDQPIDWLRMLAANIKNQAQWGKDKALRAWVTQSRLDGFSSLAKQVAPDDAEKIAVLQRFMQSAVPAMMNIAKLLPQGV